MTHRPATAREFTGRHMLIIMLAFFGVILTVNLGMAHLARSSWSGLVVENSYVASQEFNDRLKQSRAQVALQWTGRLEIANGTIRYTLSDRQARPVAATSVRIFFRHPAFEAADWSVDLKPASDGTFETLQLARAGTWTVEIDSDVGRVVPYREVRRITIDKGEIQ